MHTTTPASGDPNDPTNRPRRSRWAFWRRSTRRTHPNRAAETTREATGDIAEDAGESLLSRALHSGDGGHGGSGGGGWFDGLLDWLS